MASSLPLVLFDVGQVLTSSPSRLETLSRLAAVEPQALDGPYWRHRDAYDLGLPEPEYWGRVLTEAGASERARDGALLTALAQADAECSTRIRPEAAALLRALHAAGVEIGVLSNAPFAMARRARERSWAAAIQHWFFSSEQGMAKPDERLFHRVAAQLGRAPGEIRFIDDREVNVRAARAAGWNAHLWHSDRDSGAFLGDLGAHPEPVRTVIFDLGEVLAADPALLPRLAARAGCAEGVFTQAYWRHREAHDRGGSADAFWGAVLADAGGAPTPELIAALTAMDADAWTDIRPQAEATLRALSDAGVRICILSNAPHEVARAARGRAWVPLVDHWYFSAELGAIKPEPEIYARVVEDLHTEARELLFFDDRPENVDAACRAGWDARVWESDRVTAHTVADLVAPASGVPAL